ncbi:hypothetical protein DFH29DRAFT_881457 [Suillus ampliporus]|nr:hypothetical protein DFH29DRAFT_881457 [Suillus ampliporus]
MSSPVSDTSLSTSSFKKCASTDDILNNLTTASRQKKIKCKAVVILNPFANVSLVFHYGMTLDKGESLIQICRSEEQQSQYLAFYNGILDFIPGFHATLDKMLYDELKPYITAIQC